MATINIHEDQENRIPEICQKQNTMAVGKKRSVLGAITGNIKQVNVHKGKQPIGISKENVNVKVKNEKENECNKENRKNLVNPIVPVAQFEAFKVYEDTSYEERMARIEEKLKYKIKETSIQVYKGTAEDRFYTKTEVAELERKIKEENAAKALLVSDEQKDSLMSIEKSFDNSLQFAASLLKSSSSSKDLFFEMKEYQDDIYKYIREHELRNRPKPAYMKKQPDISSSMRTILVDWLVEVAEEYQLHTETLYLAINFIDRFLSYMSVVKAKLQLVGTAAMFLASKYEEIYPPTIKDFVYITDDTYTRRQVIRMEHLILKVLGFDLSIPTPLTFITAMCVMNKLPEKTMYLAMYISELSLLNGEVYLEFLPSAIAASAVAVARHTLGVDAWNAQLAESTGYDLKDVQAGIIFLTEMFANAPTHPQHAIQDKYKSQKYMYVSQLKPNESPIVFK